MKTTLQINRSQNFIVVLARAFCVASFLFCSWRAMAQSAPVLTIAPLGTNQFSITITNGSGTGNYELYWTPVLANPDYPWSLAAIGTTGQTNFMVSMGTYQIGFFEVIAGTDWDGDGVVNWQDANPNDPTIGILTVTIDSPATGSTLQ